jgi:choice-of-anchor B domain-containing protein
MKKFWMLAAGLLAMQLVGAQSLTLRHEVQFPFVTNSLGDVGTNDCWGWTDSMGVDYAIVGNKDHVAFVRADDGMVLDTVQLSSLGDAYYHRAIVTVGHYCYVVGEMHGKREGLVTIDMRFLPDSVHYVGNYTAGGTMIRCHEIDLDRGRPYLYMEADEQLGQNGVEIIDITDPENPTKVGFIAVTNTHDMTARNDTVWIAEGYTKAFSVYDCSDKGNPIQLGRITSPNFGYCHGIFPSDDGKLFVTTEETPNKTVKVWDASTMSNITMRGQYLGGNNLAHNVYVMGDLLVFSHYTVGVTIVDWADPDNLVEIASYDTYPQNDIADFYGTWGAFPYTQNGYIYASNFEGKLFILDWDRNGVAVDQGQPRVDGHSWPNPFVSVTNIPLQLDGTQHVTVQAMDLQGRVVETVFEGELAAGNYTLPWHPRADVAAGAYLLHITAGETVRTERVVLQR